MTPKPGLFLARVDTLPNPGAIVVDFAEGESRLSIVVTRRGDVIAAFRNRCPHAGYPMERPDGRVVIQEGRFLVCTAHGASFALESGDCAGGPCNGEALERFAIELRDESVFIA
ncbi:MAG: Rieske 2Fe-2S domain-containing protein [Hyphomonadaceae bacterium JAD_PAG50586_4]|nr:MAG: Rieske 2Fe-2S domain-containing protein [Hyphomonadaceae bacterium JAD_PAG50586_4]